MVDVIRERNYDDGEVFGSRQLDMGNTGCSPNLSSSPRLPG